MRAEDLQADWKNFEVNTVNSTLLTLGQLLFDAFHPISLRQQMPDGRTRIPAPPSRQVVFPTASCIVGTCMADGDRGMYIHCLSARAYIPAWLIDMSACRSCVPAPNSSSEETAEQDMGR